MLDTALPLFVCLTRTAAALFWPATSIEICATRLRPFGPELEVGERIAVGRKRCFESGGGGIDAGARGPLNYTQCRRNRDLRDGAIWCFCTAWCWDIGEDLADKASFADPSPGRSIEKIESITSAILRSTIDRRASS